jgi:hypothetical protein
VKFTVTGTGTETPVVTIVEGVKLRVVISAARAEADSAISVNAIVRRERCTVRVLVFMTGFLLTFHSWVQRESLGTAFTSPPLGGGKVNTIKPDRPHASR